MCVCHRARSSVSMPIRAAPRKAMLVTIMEVAVIPAGRAPSSAARRARLPNHPKNTAAPRRGAAAAAHHLDGPLAMFGPAGKRSWSRWALTGSQLSGNGGSLVLARSPAWARARLSRKAMSAPSGADAMIFLIASFTSTTSPASTASISRARRSYSSEETLASLTTPAPGALPRVWVEGGCRSLREVRPDPMPSRPCSSVGLRLWILVGGAGQVQHIDLEKLGVPSNT
jgi:hypothetical protein